MTVRSTTFLFRRIAILSFVLAAIVGLSALFIRAAVDDFEVEVVLSQTNLTGGQDQVVGWQTSAEVHNVDIYVSYDDGSSFTLLETAVDVDDVYTWSVPNISSDSLRIRVDVRNGTDKIRGRDISERLTVTQNPSLPLESVKDLEGFDPVSEYYLPRTEVEALLPSGVDIGDLVRSDSLPAVYYISGDGLRHPFPNETVYFSWFIDFGDVKTVSDQTLSDITLGEPVRVRPGTWMVKIQSLPKVYIVEPGGILRWVPTEEVARIQFGEDWNQRIIDIEPTLFTRYTVNSNLCECGQHALGSLLERDGVYYYVAEDATIRPFADDRALEANYFQKRFAAPANDIDFDKIPGVTIRAHEEILSDYQDVGR